MEQFTEGVLHGDERSVNKLDGVDESGLGSLMKVQHKSIVQLIGYCYEIAHKHTEHNGNFVFSQVIDQVLSFKYMHGGSPVNHIPATSCIQDWPTAYKIIRGTCEGLHYLHERQGGEDYIHHPEVKPDNILLDKVMIPRNEETVSFNRFSASKTHGPSTMMKTEEFMSPEYIDNRMISEENDVFSLGVLIFHIMAGDTGYNDYRDLCPRGDGFIEIVEEYWKRKKTLATTDYAWEEMSNLVGMKQCTEIAKKCVETDRKKRPTTKEIIDDLNKLNPKPLIGQSLPVATMSRPVGGCSWKWALGVVIVYAFDCATSSPSRDKAQHEVFWLVQEKLTQYFPGSFLGYTYVMLTPDTYTSDMKLVDSSEIKANGYTRSLSWRRTACTESMSAGLYEAHRLISGHPNGIILFFSDGLINKGDFFHGAEDFISIVPVHTFTLGGSAYNDGLRTIAANSPGGEFSPLPVPDKLSLSVPFSRLFDRILSGTTKYAEELSRPDSEWWPLDVVIVHAFDCTDSTPAWYKINEVFWLVQEKLTHFVDSCLGYIYTMSTPNTYTSDMKLVDSSEYKVTGCMTSSARRRAACTKNMASGLSEAHNLIGYRGHWNGIILLFSDGLINKGDFFDGAEDFISQVPVHTFTLGGDAYNHVLRAIAENSRGGIFCHVPVPDKPGLPLHFSRLLDSMLNGTRKEIIDNLNILDSHKPLAGQQRPTFDANGTSGIPQESITKTCNPHHLPLQHLKDITNNFCNERILGRGGFGVVYKGVQQNGEIIAVKKLVQALPSLSSQKQFENEVNLLMKLKHPNIVRLVGYCYETQHLHMPHEKEFVFAENIETLLCLECLPNGSLDKYISDASSGLDWHTRHKIIEGISYGLQYLHEQSNDPIVHLDLKPANILLDEKMVPKITDFGLSRLFDQTQTMCTAITSGTKGYMPPEYVERGIISPMFDIFSLGVIIMEIITGHRDYPYDIRKSSRSFIEHELKEWRNMMINDPWYMSLEIDCQQIERCIQIGLICVNRERAKRPAVKTIIAMLQGLDSMDWYTINELLIKEIQEEL